MIGNIPTLSVLKMTVLLSVPAALIPCNASEHRKLGSASSENSHCRLPEHLRGQARPQGQGEYTQLHNYDIDQVGTRQGVLNEIRKQCVQIFVESFQRGAKANREMKIERSIRDQAIFEYNVRSIDKLNVFRAYEKIQEEKDINYLREKFIYELVIVADATRNGFLKAGEYSLGCFNWYFESFRGEIDEQLLKTNGLRTILAINKDKTEHGWRKKIRRRLSIQDLTSWQIILAVLSLLIIFFILVRRLIQKDQGASIPIYHKDSISKN